MLNSQLARDIEKLRERHDNEITAMMNNCRHKDDDGKSTVDRDFRCAICDTEVIDLGGL
jgi:nitrite reductase/ring-hydroxylating ferredoxin subunit